MTSASPETGWRKFSNSGNCVEVARLPNGQVAVRDSKDPDGPVVTYSRDAWRHFVRGLRSAQPGFTQRIRGL